MTGTWGKLARVAMDALEIAQTARGGSVTPHKARGGSIARVDGGYVVELLSEPVLECPHCHRPLPRPATRRRRLVNVTAGGRVLSTEIDP